jgi:hypothetical protein
LKDHEGDSLGYFPENNVGGVPVKSIERVSLSLQPGDHIISAKVDTSGVSPVFVQFLIFDEGF